jgi:RNA polymerase sigma-54 factor
VAETETLADHLLWQLHLSHLSSRPQHRRALIDALDDDGYLREPLATIAETLLPAIHADEDEILAVLHRIQRFDPVGVAARTLGECLQLQLDVLPATRRGWRWRDRLPQARWNGCRAAASPGWPMN